MKKAIMVFLAAVLVVSAATANSWKVDGSHSKVEFNVTHLMISDVTGRFTQFDVTLKQGKEDFSGSTVEAVIKTASVTTDNDGRDKHLKGDDFFNAEKFPEMKFVSTAFEKTGKDTYRIPGTLTIRDVSKPVVLEGKFLGSTKDPWGNTKIGFKATTTINRQEFGVKWNKSLDAGGMVVSDDVEVTLAIQFVGEKK
jgi:polyisoprenoid-binding protein YceI